MATISIKCYGGYSGAPAPDHSEIITGPSYEQANAAATLAGWKLGGYGWVCPVCANDPEEVPVVEVQLEGCCGPTVHRSIDSALEELRCLLEDGNEEEDIITITRRKMTRGEVNCLPEFEGY